MTTPFFSILASMLLLQGTSTETALQPVGLWSVAREPSACVLSRDFGTGKNRLTLSVDPGLLSGTITVAAEVADAGRKNPAGGTGTFKIGTYEAVKIFSNSWSNETKTKKVSFDINAQELALMASSDAITVPLNKSLSTVIDLEGASSALQTLNTCRSDTLRAWGIDPTAASSIAKRPRAINPENWVQNNDYPEDALRKHLQGITELVLAIGPDGHITNCRIVKTSGYEILDRASCTALARPSHRFTPAENAAGQPTLGWTWISQRWRLPT